MFIKIETAIIKGGNIKKKVLRYLPVATTFLRMFLKFQLSNKLNLLDKVKSLST